MRTVAEVDAEAAYRLCSYRPLSSTGAGRRASEEFSIPGFVDGSCRREPDLQARYPSITTLCRYDRFAPHLQVGHRIAYITVKGEYGEEEPHWRLVACLRVIKRFETHGDAAAWYRSKKLPLPSNCMVAGNGPLPLDRTLSPRRDLRSWNAGYAYRAKSLGTFLVCKREALNLTDPPRLAEADFLDIFGRIPGTRTPSKIERHEYEALRVRLGRR